MLNRRILRIKAFKVLYSYAENPDLTLKEALGNLDASCEATRDLYLYMLALIPALTGEAARRAEAARGKFNPTEEDLHPNLKFVRNGISALLENDPDFQRLLEKKKFSWEQSDAFIHGLYEALKTRPWFAGYLAAEGQSLKADAALWKHVFEEEFEDNEDLAAILEDISIHWSDDLPYVLNVCLRSLDAMGRSGRWEFPPLYQSDSMQAQGKDVQSDRVFVHSLLSAAYGRFQVGRRPPVHHRHGPHRDGPFGGRDLPRHSGESYYQRVRGDFQVLFHAQEPGLRERPAGPPHQRKSKQTISKRLCIPFFSPS